MAPDQDALADWTLQRLGDQAWELHYRPGCDADSCRRLARLATILRQRADCADLVQAYDRLAFFPRNGNGDGDATALRDALLAHWPALRDRPVQESDEPALLVPVVYDGPDLDNHAAACGLSVEALIQRHSASSYSVAAIGFRPHFAYLLGLDPSLARPRRDEPRTSVAAGSVAIGGDQTAIYPDDGPGGWHCIGRCDPAICRRIGPESRIRFIPRQHKPDRP